jgi:hypothetical protein
MKIIPQEVITDYLSTPAKVYEGMANLAQSIFEASNQLAKEAKPSLEVANGILANSNYLTILVGRASQLAFFNTQLLAIQVSRELEERIGNDSKIKH